MARGFESKSVSDQQEELLRKGDRDPRIDRPSPHRRCLELARADLLRRIAHAPPRHQDNLRLALAALEEQIRGL
jgi:hypothetical protein